MKILTYPNSILTEVSEPVIDFDGLDTFCDELHQTMLESDGIGLSAVQVGVLKRIIVMQLPDGERYDIINPEIVEIARGMFVYSEGCLSVPGFYDDRARHVGINLRYQTPTGETVEKWFEELEAFCIQHEIDHLDGKLFIDDLSPLKKERIRKKIDKWKRTNKTSF